MKSATPLVISSSQPQTHNNEYFNQHKTEQIWIIPKEIFQIMHKLFSFGEKTNRMESDHIPNSEQSLRTKKSDHENQSILVCLKNHH